MRTWLVLSDAPALRDTGQFVSVRWRRNRLASIRCVTSFKSESASTIQAALPPSSKTTFFFPARAFKSQPTAGEPVKLSNFKRSSVVNKSAPSRRQGRIENAPLGKLVSASTSPMISAPIGVRLAGFKTNGQPTAIVGATLWAARFNGKLNGEMNEHGPQNDSIRFVVRKAPCGASARPLEPKRRPHDQSLRSRPMRLSSQFIQSTCPLRPSPHSQRRVHSLDSRGMNSLT